VQREDAVAQEKKERRLNIPQESRRSLCRIQERRGNICGWKAGKTPHIAKQAGCESGGKQAQKRGHTFGGGGLEGRGEIRITGRVNLTHRKREREEESNAGTKTEEIREETGGRRSNFDTEIFGSTCD